MPLASSSCQGNQKTPKRETLPPCLWRPHHARVTRRRRSVTPCLRASGVIIIGIITATLSSSLPPHQHQNLITTTSSYRDVVLRSHLGSTSRMCPDCATAHEQTEGIVVSTRGACTHRNLFPVTHYTSGVSASMVATVPVARGWDEEGFIKKVVSIQRETTVPSLTK